jgi:hypothetical protein
LVLAYARAAAPFGKHGDFPLRGAEGGLLAECKSVTMFRQLVIKIARMRDAI